MVLYSKPDSPGPYYSYDSLVEAEAHNISYSSMAHMARASSWAYGILAAVSLWGTDQIVENGVLFYYLDKAFLVDKNQHAKERNGAAPRWSINSVPVMHHIQL